jgi:hypothetical protein
MFCNVSLTKRGGGYVESAILAGVLIGTKPHLAVVAFLCGCGELVKERRLAFRDDNGSKPGVGA